MAGRLIVASGERVCAVCCARAMSALGERRQTTKIIIKRNLLSAAAVAACHGRQSACGDFREWDAAATRPGAASSGGGGRPARGPSATEIAKTYRGPAPRRLRDMCANEKERGHRPPTTIIQNNRTDSTTAISRNSLFIQGDFWFVLDFGPSVQCRFCHFFSTLIYENQILGRTKLSSFCPYSPYGDGKYGTTI